MVSLPIFTKRRTEKLLCLCIGPAAESPSEEILRLIKGGIDFEYLAETACEKQVASLLYNAVKFYTPKNAVEETALRKLRVRYLASAASNEHYKKELINILAAFRDKGIDVIPLKGILLAEILYGDSAYRDQSVDVDILVREKDREYGRRILEGLGYYFTPVGEKEEYGWFYAFHKQGQRMVELHWDITMMARSAARIEGLWRGTEEMARDGARYLGFKPEELLLYLSTHLVNSDSFRKLKYICDINRVIEKYGDRIDRGRLIQKAADWNMRGSLYTGLMLNDRIFGSAAPGYPMRGADISYAKRLFIQIFTDEKVIFKKGSLRRRFLDIFLSYILLECVEARSVREYLAIVKRIFSPKIVDLMKAM